MPRKDGSLTPQEIAFVDAYAELPDKQRAERKAKLSPNGAWQVLQRPEIQRQIVARQSALLVTEGLTVAVATLLEVMRNPKAPAAARVTASKIILDRALPDGRGPGDREPHEMTPEELAAAIDRLEQLAAARAKEVGESPPQLVANPPSDLFD